MKNLLKLTMKNMVTVEFANVSIGMYIIPMFLSTTVSYVITALQFNNLI